MPAVKKVTRDDIVNAAFDVLRDGGFASVNARSVAAKLGCSTQPIYLSFRNMDELKQELSKRAMKAHTDRIIASFRENNAPRIRYIDYGIGFVRFAEQEKQLFRWLYLEGGQIGARLGDIHIDEIVQIVSEDFGYDEETARRLHLDMMYYSYGLAILANTGAPHMDDDTLKQALHREFVALQSIYGKPKTQSPA